MTSPTNTPRAGRHLTGDPLLDAQTAALNRHRADSGYRQALEHARAAGISYAQLAAALGLTRQSVREYLLNRKETP